MQEGIGKLFKQFSFPGGIPSHCSPDTPGSMHEGGELGYSLSHAFGAVLDKPNLIVACVVGDGEAEVSAFKSSNVTKTKSMSYIRFSPINLNVIYFLEILVRPDHLLQRGTATNS